jgi:hypothetical protein
VSHPVSEPAKTGLEDPRAVQILTIEHWSLLSTRTLGYQEMIGRATIFTAVVSGVIVALALLAQVTHFGTATLSFALALIPVALFIGLTTFVRSVAINYEDARWVTGMKLLRDAYLKIVPELEPFLVAWQWSKAAGRPLGHGSRQRLAQLAHSLTTTSSVVAAMNSVLAGALASDVGALRGASVKFVVCVGSGISLVSAACHILYAARFRRSHLLPARASGDGSSAT